MAQYPSASTVAAMTGILGSAWAAGGIAALSTIAMPGLVVASVSVPAQTLARQWEAMFRLGKSTMPVLALVSLLGYAYRAYDRKSQGLGWRRPLVAGFLTLSIVPYTIATMSSTNSSLLQAASGAAALGDEAVRSLVCKWKDLNLLRSFLPLAGAILGLWDFVAWCRDVG